MFEWQRKHGSWVVGEYDGETFNAKVFDEGSVLGIDGGRVSKLFYRGVEYDREWVNKPTKEVAPVYKGLLYELENLPHNMNKERQRFPKIDIYN